VALLALSLFAGHAANGEVLEGTQAATAAPVRLCEHGVPGDLCTKCTPELVPVFQESGDWCGKHGLPLSQCTECNPDLEFSQRATPQDWCGEHAVPESMCTKCHPDLVAKFVAARDYCREHGYPQSVCPRCNPELLVARGEVLPVFPKPGTRVRLASTETVREIGIQLAAAEQRRLTDAIMVVGRLDFDQNRLAQLSARSEAVVLEVNADTGDPVRTGQPLIVLASAQVGEDQARLSSAKARRDAATASLAREQSLAKDGISSRKSVEAARSELAAARGEHEAALSALRAAGALADSHGGRYVLTAPLDGTVVARDAVVGKMASPGQPLLQIADLSTMWALLEVPEGEAARVHAGQKVSLRFDALGGMTRDATISRVAGTVDPQTRTVRARVEVPNPDGALKAGLFIRATIEVGAERDALLVPSDAVQRAEGQALVFVEEDAGVYIPVPVELGAVEPEGTEIVSGLRPGTRVVTTGAFLLKTEILKESIGAGCCEEGGE
jgi:cobalt-zinc-cadmium efflux system membrane fusion protein